jgi:hypothetical protein
MDHAHLLHTTHWGYRKLKRDCYVLSCTICIVLCQPFYTPFLILFIFSSIIATR